MEPWNKKDLEWQVNENGCWICISHSVNKDGYITFKRDGQNTAHRYMYQKFNGEIKNDLVVRHKCDTPSCINPEHLEIGTHMDNVNDKVGRNRQSKGESHGRSKLTEDQVKFILLTEDHTYTELIEMFNVSGKVISQIWNRKTWKHIDVDTTNVKRKKDLSKRKLFDDQVREIRSSKESARKLGKKFNVDEKAVRDIRNYKTYTDVI
jgi:hypothetical protein